MTLFPVSIFSQVIVKALDRAWLRIEHRHAVCSLSLACHQTIKDISVCIYSPEFNVCLLCARHCAGAEGTQRNKTTFLPERDSHLV